MAYEIERVPVWIAEIKDRPGALAEKLEALSSAGANLNFLLARRDKNGAGLIFLTPLKGAGQARVAEKLKLKKAGSLFSLRLEGPDKPGLGANVTRAIADAGINLRGISAASVGRRTVFNFTFESRQDVTKTIRVIKKVLRMV